MRLKLIRHK